jgi:phage tail tube protein FII
MPATLYVMEDCNVICGDSGTEANPGISTHLTLSEMKMPGFEEAYVDHMAGAAPVAIEVAMHFNKLEATFNLAGWQPEVMTFIGRNERVFGRFTAYGLIRDRRTGDALQAIAVMEGHLGRVNPQAFRKSDLLHHEYSIRGITHYDLRMQTVPESEPVPIYFWDFYTSKFIVGGFDVNQDRVRLLAIPGTSG